MFKITLQLGNPLLDACLSLDANGIQAALSEAMRTIVN